MSVRDLLNDLEIEARRHAVGLEADGKLPSDFSEKHYPLTRAKQRELKRLRAALVLAPDADTFCALARREAVPIERLNPEAVRFHKRRREHGH